LPLAKREPKLQCGLAVVNLSTGQIVGTFWFNSGVEEVFAISVLPGYRNTGIVGPDADRDGAQSVWRVPAINHL
jgi:hypothetical protein